MLRKKEYLLVASIVVRQTITVAITIDKIMNKTYIPTAIAIGCVDQQEYSLFIILFFMIKKKKEKK